MREILTNAGIQSHLIGPIAYLMESRRSDSLPITPADISNELDLITGLLQSVSKKVRTYHKPNATEICERLAVIMAKPKPTPREACAKCGNTESGWYVNRICEKCSNSGESIDSIVDNLETYREENRKLQEAEETDEKRDNPNGGQGAKLEPEKPVNPKGPPSAVSDLDLIMNIS